MEHCMRKVLLLVAAGLVAFGAPVLSLAPAASAASGPTLGCNIQPSGNDNFTPRCTTSYARSKYTVDYFVSGGSGTYTYAWTPPTGGTIVAGCTSTNPDCELTFEHGSEDSTLKATVVLTQGSTKTTLTATAFIPAVCGTMFC
jgi:hypothetical protein